VTRTGFYPKGHRRGPYQHLAEEFDRRLKALHGTGTIPDPRDRQIARLKEENTALRDRITERDAELEGLAAFKEQALSRLAAQHEEIQRLRQYEVNSKGDTVRGLPVRSRSVIGPCA
jgi:uncharacterized protein (DUF3084 family)